jgi:hypothetical protein
VLAAGPQRSHAFSRISLPRPVNAPVPILRSPNLSQHGPQGAGSRGRFWSSPERINRANTAADRCADAGAPRVLWQLRPAGPTLPSDTPQGAEREKDRWVGAAHGCHTYVTASATLSHKCDRGRAASQLVNSKPEKIPQMGIIHKWEIPLLQCHLTRGCHAGKLCSAQCPCLTAGRRKKGPQVVLCGNTPEKPPLERFSVACATALLRGQYICSPLSFYCSSYKWEPL